MKLRNIINRVRETVENTLIPGKTITRQVNGHRMTIAKNDTGIGLALRRMRKGDPDREPAFMEIIENEVQPGMTVVDIGANIGHVSVNLGLLVGPSGFVYALEPHPINVQLLRRNLSANGYGSRSAVYEIGVSSHEGSVEFFLAKESNLGALHQTPYGVDQITVDVISLDKFFADKSKPHFLKMDVEGAEIEVLDGFKKTALSSPRGLKILIEVHPTYYSEERNFRRQLQEYFEMGFETKFLISAGVSQPDWFRSNGLSPDKVFQIGNLSRGIYSNIPDDLVIESICNRHRQFIPKQNCYHDKIVRAIMLEKTRA